MNSPHGRCIRLFWVAMMSSGRNYNHMSYLVTTCMYGTDVMCVHFIFNY